MIEETPPQEGEVTPEEPVVETTPAEELSDVEQQAYAKGWRPQEEFEGEGWIGAEEFLGRAPLYDGLSKQGKAIKQLQRTIENLAEHNRKVEESALSRAREELKAHKVSAYEEQDFNKVVEIEKQERELEAQQEKVDANPTPQIFLDWKEANEWYGNDFDMTIYADGYGRQLKESNPNLSGKEAFDAVTAKVKEVFPQNFGGTRLPNRGHPSTKGSVRTPAKSSAGFASLTAEQQKICNEFVEAGVMTKEEYVKQIKEVS